MEGGRFQGRWVEALPGAVTVHREGGRWVLCLSGEIDVLVIEQFEQTRRSAPVAVDIIDTGAVSFMSACGISLMLRHLNASTEAGRSVTLRRPSPCVIRLLRLVGVEGMFQLSE